MPLNKEKLAKILKAVKRGSSHRIEEMVEFSKKYKKYNKDIGRQIEKFVTKSGPDNMKGALFVIDALCTSDRAHRAKEKEQGKQQKSFEQFDNEDETSTASYQMFREYFNNLDRLKLLFHYIMRAPEEDHRHINKILDHWSNSRWFNDECREYLSGLLNSPGGGSGSGDVVDDDEPVIVSGYPPAAPTNDYDYDDDGDQYVEPSTFEIMDISMDDVIVGTDQFGHISDVFGMMDDDDVPEIMQGGSSAAAAVSSAFDYYDDDDEDDDERRIEQQKIQLEEDRRRLLDDVDQQQHGDGEDDDGIEVQISSSTNNNNNVDYEN